MWARMPMVTIISGGPGGGNNRVNCAADAGDTANGFTATTAASAQTIEVADIAIAAFAAAGYGCETTPAMDFRYSLGTNGDLILTERLEGPDVYGFRVTKTMVTMATIMAWHFVGMLKT